MALHSFTLGQSLLKNADGFDYKKIYASCLDANIKSALGMIDVGDDSLSVKDRNFKSNFEKRFKGPKDLKKYDSVAPASINELLTIFREYWRTSLLNSSKDSKPKLARKIVPFLIKNYPLIRRVNVERDSLGTYLSRFVRSKGLYTTEVIDVSGDIVDLVIWSSQKDTTFTFSLPQEEITAKVIMMENFLTLGWREYATLGAHYPGGWAEDDAIYCVKKAYDLSSENFQISYLAHEGRHYSDFKLFPELQNADLEYRAKLTELSLAKTTLYDLIQFFIDNSNFDSSNGHSVANFFVVRTLSRAIFHIDFESDINKWKKVNGRKINKIAYKELKKNTKALHKVGSEVKTYIKN